jgi:RNA 3'-terminal phosphate cyclase (ATP)
VFSYFRVFVIQFFCKDLRTMSRNLVQLDGSFGEGGGQILRSSLALSLLTGRPFRLRNIRANRSRPGLQPQHLMSVLAAAEIGSAKLKGAKLGSSTLDFEPGPVAAGNFHFRIGTAGATGLVLHTVYLPLALAKTPSTVTIEGGTHVAHSPCYHFLDRSWRAYMAAIGLQVSLRMERSGFYPRGGGVVHADIRPAQLLGYNPAGATPVTRVHVLSGVAGLPEHIRRRQAARAADRLTERGLEVEVHEESWPGGPGTMLGVELPTEPAPTFFFALGERGKPAEKVADEAVAQVEAFLDGGPAGIDEHSSDQLLLPLALSPEGSRFRTACVSSHLLTNAAVIQQFLPRQIVCDRDEGQPGTVIVHAATDG